MTIHSPGICKSENETRKNVLFRLGHQSECLVNVSNYATCGDLQSDISKIILGAPPHDFVERY